MDRKKKLIDRLPEKFKSVRRKSLFVVTLLRINKQNDWFNAHDIAHSVIFPNVSISVPRISSYLLLLTRCGYLKCVKKLIQFPYKDLLNHYKHTQKWDEIANIIKQFYD